MAPAQPPSDQPLYLDSGTACVWRGSQNERLSRREFTVLAMLMAHPGKVCKSEELLAAAWPQAKVYDSALKKLINQLRRKLQDSAKTPKYIQTVSGWGYQFIGPLAGATPPPESACPGAAVPISQRPLMVGREAELEQLLHRWQRACLGRRCLVFVTGEAGIGKTMLVDAFATEVSTRGGGRLARGQCVEHYGAEEDSAGEPYRPVLEALDQLGRMPAWPQARAVLRQYAPMWLSQMPQHLTDAEHEGLQRKLVGARAERMVRELAEALEALTRDTWLVLILEDLHWSDGATVELLDVLARRREPARLMIVATYRPGEVYRKHHPILGAAQQLLLHDHCVELRLPLLSEETVYEYLLARFPDHAVPKHLATKLHRRTEGNPLFLGAVLKPLCDIDLGTLQGGEEVWDRPEVTDAILQSVPNTLQQMIETYITQLPIEEQRALEIGSVVGETFTAAAVAAGLEVEIDLVEAWCTALLRKQFFLDPWGSEEWPDGTMSERYRFAHALYREVVYNQIPLAQRLRFHQRVSLRLEQGYGARASELAAQLAVHCELGQNLWRAVHYRRQAAQNALRLFAYQEAIAHLSRAQELVDALPDTPERRQQELALQLALGPACSAIKGYAAPESRQAYARARELCRQVRVSPQLFPALFGLWTFYFARAECQVAQELGEQLLAMANQAGDTALLLEAHQLLAATSWHRGEFPQARQHLEHSHALYDPRQHHTHTAIYGQDPEVVGLSYMALTLWVCGAQTQSLQASQQAISFAQQLAHPYNLVFAHSLAAILESFRRQVESVRAHAEAAISLARTHGFVYWRAHGTILRGWASAHQKLEEGLDEMHQGIAAWRETGASLAVPYYLTLLAERSAQTGRIDEALDLATEGLDVMATTQERFFEAELRRLQGELLLARATASRQEAELCFQEALIIARRQRAKSWEVQAALSLSRLWHEEGKRDAARALLDGVYGRLTEECDTSYVQLEPLGWALELGAQDTGEYPHRLGRILQGSKAPVMDIERPPWASGLSEHTHA